MKKHISFKHSFVFALVATLCMPAQAMMPALRQAGQKASAAITSTLAASARRARLGASTLTETTKNIQRAIGDSRNAQNTVMPIVRPQMTRFYTNTYAQRMAAAQPLKSKTLNITKNIIGCVTAIGTGVGTVYTVTNKTDPALSNRIKMRLDFTTFKADHNKYNTAKQGYDNKENLTVTEKHILLLSSRFKYDTHYSHDLSIMEPILTSPIMKSMANLIIAEERKYQKDYYTFVHGQSSEYLLPEKIFTDLFCTHNNIPEQDFLFAHIRNNDDTKKDAADHKKLLNGIDHSDPERKERRQKLLFLNAPLFGNTTSPGSSTAVIFFENKNKGEIKTPLKSVFELHGDADIYEKFKKKFDILEEKFASIGKGHGTILFFAIPKKMAEKYVIPTAPGGFKEKISVINEGSTDDINVIMEAYQHHQEDIPNFDRHEFCLIMCGEAMNPQSGIKVKIFNAADHYKMAELLKEYDTVMADVKVAIKAKIATTPLPLESIFQRYQEIFI